MNKILLVFLLAFSIEVFARKKVEPATVITIPEYRQAVTDKVKLNRKVTDECKKKAKPKKGRLVLAWEISEKGEARNFTKASDTVENEELYHCLVKKIEKIKFQAPPLERALDVEHEFAF